MSSSTRRLQSPLLSLAETPSDTDRPRLDPPSRVTSCTDAPGHLVGPPEFGSLHLQPCDLSTFFAIDRSTFGLYDLIDGVLIAHDMPTEKHDRQAHFLLAEFNENQRAGRVPQNIQAVLSPTVAIPQPAPSSSAASSPTHAQRRNYSIRIPDLAYGEKWTTEKRETLSPPSRKLTFPLACKVDTVVECTSHNRRTDMVEKPEEYARRQVRKLFVIDNDLPHEDNPQKHRPAVYDVSMVNGRGHLGQPRTGDETLSMGHCGEHRAKTLLDPPSPSARARRNAHEERRRLEEAEKQAQEEKDSRREAEKQAQEEKDRRREEEHRRREAEKRAKKEKDSRREAEKQAEKEKDSRREAEKQAEKEKDRRREAEKQAEKEKDRRREEEHRRREEEHRRREEEHRRKKAEERATKQQSKRMRERERKQRYKEMARRAGEEVSGSSSSSSSPPRKQRR